jgi:hypothetical protein
MAFEFHEYVFLELSIKPELEFPYCSGAHFRLVGATSSAIAEREEETQRPWKKLHVLTH